MYTRLRSNGGSNIIGDTMIRTLVAGLVLLLGMPQQPQQQLR
jgi:hypothetical protein